MKKESSRNEWSGKSRGGALGYLSFVYIIKTFGLTAAYALLAIVVIYFIPFAPKATSSVWYFSRKILGNSRLGSLIFLYKNYFSLGVTLIDKTAVAAGKADEFSFEFHEPEEVKKILNDKSGAIIIGAHFGNWEVGAPFFDKYGKEMRVVMMDAEYQKIKMILEREKRVDTFKVISISEDIFSNIFEIRDALAEGAYVAIQGDRLTSSTKNETVKFMGADAQFPLGPFIIAARFGFPVVFYYAVRTGFKHYSFHFSLCPVSGSNPQKRVFEKLILEEYVKSLEKVVKIAPEQWYNYYKFWI